MNIMFVGYSGSGKSTLAKILSDHYGIPLLHLDTLQFEPNWVIRDPQKRDQDVYAFLNDHASWVIDGNYRSAYFDMRIKKADQIIILNYNRLTCLKHVIKRYMTYKNHVRESIAHGCDEKLDFEFLIWVLFKGRSKVRRKSYKDISIKHFDKTHVFKNKKALNHYLSHLGIDDAIPYKR